MVAFAESVEQVSGVARLCNEHRVPLIPFGSGTGLEGGINAIKVRYFEHGYVENYCGIIKFRSG